MIGNIEILAIIKQEEYLSEARSARIRRSLLLEARKERPRAFELWKLLRKRRQSKAELGQRAFNSG
jgi:hypothetical protein